MLLSSQVADETRQDMRRLSEIAGALITKQEWHQGQLEQAQLQALQVLNTLDSVSATAVTFRSNLLGGLGLTKWWPYIVCPITSLIIGSYGLPPSAVRNVVLVGIGECASWTAHGNMLTTCRRNFGLPDRFGKAVQRAAVRGIEDFGE